MRGGQRPFGIFPKIHPIRWPDPSLSRLSRQKRHFKESKVKKDDTLPKSEVSRDQWVIISTQY